MKTYGKKINANWEDNKKFAPKSSIRNEEELGGDIKNSIRSSKVKRRLRKKLKVKARQEEAKIVNKEYVDNVLIIGGVEWEDETDKINNILYPDDPYRGM